jgi:hypothetical protein
MSCAIVAIAWTATIGLRAQAPAPPNPQPNPTTATRFVVIGCISRQAQASPATNRGASTGPTFILTDTRSVAPVIYQLDGDETTLSFHVGHTVEIAGPLSAVSGAGSAPNPVAPVPKILKVGSLTYLATTCLKMK